MAWTAPRTWTDGELVTASIMNAHVRDNELAIGPHLIVRKTADESVTSSTVLQNDDALLMAVAANEVWRFEFLLLAEGSGGGILGAFAFPSGGRVGILATLSNDSNSSAVYSTGTGTSGTAIFQTAAGNLSASPNYGAVLIAGVFTNAGTAGNFTLQWAQATSSVTATTVKTHSTLWAVKLA